MKEIKCAVVGCGGIAQTHARALQNLPEIRPVAFADIKPERAKALAEKCGGTAHASLEEMLQEESFEVLHICTPHYLHTPMAELAASHGIHVFSEKPPVISREQWAELTALQGKVKIGICFQNRYNESVQWVKAVLKGGKAGRILGARAFVTWQRGEKYYTESGWRGSLETEGGGVLINQSIHTVDLLTQLLGRPKQVEAGIANHHLKGIIQVEDTMEAYLDFGDKSALFYATTAHCTDSPVLLELVCENVTIRMEEREISCRWTDGRRENVSFPAPKDQVGKAYWGSSHQTCIEDFYHSLSTGSPFPNDLPGITDTAETMLSLYESAREHRVVKV